LFYSNGIFIKNVKFEDDKFLFELNDSSRRYNITNANGKDIAVEINVEWLGSNLKVLVRKSVSLLINYGKQREGLIVNTVMFVSRLTVLIIGGLRETHILRLQFME